MMHLLFLVTYPYRREKSNVRDKYIKENMEFLLFPLTHTNNFSLEDQEWHTLF